MIYRREKKWKDEWKNEGAKRKKEKKKEKMKEGSQITIYIRGEMP